ncbi:hypothetical protein CS8_024210 [Cupriavidus sp. 8B]
MLRAMEEPLRQIVLNVGEEASVIVAKVIEGKGNYGYNAVSGAYGDLIEMGELEPTKVTCAALQNAASAASLMLTTDCAAAETLEGRLGSGNAGRPGRHDVVCAD